VDYYITSELFAPQPTAPAAPAALGVVLAERAAGALFSEQVIYLTGIDHLVGAF
jgi:hypothetical protein